MMEILGLRIKLIGTWLGLDAEEVDAGAGKGSDTTKFL